MLRKCCLKFRELYMDISGGICPFMSGITIANICAVLWRTRYLKVDHIPVVQKPAKRKQSFKALKWLEWESKKANMPIQSAGTGGEKQIGRYFVDGYNEEDKRVFEFYGCHWHGCLKCNNPETVHPLRGVEMKFLHQETLTRQAFIESQGYTVTAMWEHDFDELRKTNQGLREFVSEINVREPLMPRDAFKGGRVNAFKLLHNVEPDEKIFYYDVTSGE